MGCTASTVATEAPAVTSDTKKTSYPVVGSNDIMRRKAHGTSATPVQASLRWEVDVRRADKISNYNRHFAEPSGTFDRDRTFRKEFAQAKRKGEPINFYDSNTGKLLYTAPIGRSHDEFWKESQAHGWPSFRDAEVNWEHVRCLKNGESVSLDGTHLGHNLPDRKGNRYCINLCCIAGKPIEKAENGDNV